MGGRRLRAIAAAVAAACMWAAAAGVVARADASIWQSPGISPPGANDFSCRPTAAHPEPVVLVHGTFGDMTVSWNQVSPALRAQGCCVFALDLPRRATAPIERSASELASFVDRVLAATGASRVSIVGHSQGGMLPRYYVRSSAG